MHAYKCLNSLRNITM
ncbi:hypothetical protein F383_07515 [Gossypium arboreum]|uniref:Uncharacterized protein n=1 Tax=Gossypium arboreum TaxID=29729 RepID=A0A0B0N566_GOSAR|nr:hypothetical protein F383_07515 [Gossypium arboreum]